MRKIIKNQQLVKIQIADFVSIALVFSIPRKSHGEGHRPQS